MTEFSPGYTMDKTSSSNWLSATRETVSGYRLMIDRTVEQLTDEELFARPTPGIHSVAVILRHLGGNLHSRWTDFLTTDGEKPDRDRETEFADWEGDRTSLMQHFDRGWRDLDAALEAVDDENVTRTIYIRGEAHTVAQALVRSVTHLGYHVGQMSLVARTVHRGEWTWLTVAPGGSVPYKA